MFHAQMVGYSQNQYQKNPFQTSQMPIWNAGTGQSHHNSTRRIICVHESRIRHTTHHIHRNGLMVISVRRESPYHGYVDLHKPRDKNLEMVQPNLLVLGDVANRTSRHHHPIQWPGPETLMRTLRRTGPEVFPHRDRLY